jgi:uncharacterized membrane protein HdeD (DUF308 family)
MSGVEAEVIDSSGESVHPGPSFWLMPVVAGLISLAAGIVVLVAPKGSLETIALILGIYLVVVGLHGAYTALANPDETGGHRGLVLTMGVLALIAGIIVILRPGATVTGVAIAFGIFLILSGLRYLFLAAVLPDKLPALVRGVLEIAGGVIVVVWPKIGLTTLAVVLGIYLTLGGLLQLFIGFALRRATTSAKA